jgi:hypothetical protein
MQITFSISSFVVGSIVFQGQLHLLVLKCVCVVVDFPKGYLMTWLVLLERKEGEEEKKMKPADLQSLISHKKRKHSAV